jgi:glucose/arabinose dehydrogenase
VVLISIIKLSYDLQVVTENGQIFIIVFTAILTILVLVSFPLWHFVSPALARAKITTEVQNLTDSSLKSQLIIRGLKAPSAMAFIGLNDILVTEKNRGNIQRITNGIISSQPLLHVDTTKKDERGLLGMTTSTNNESKKTFVFLYFTEAQLNDSGSPNSRSIG